MTEVAERPTAPEETGERPEAGGVGDYVRAYFKRVRAGDLGSLPIIIGLVIIAVVFQSLNENFLTARNFVNLIVQMAGLTAIATGVVFVLLTGEIDLSVSYVSGTAAVIMARLAFGPDALPWFVAIAAALLAGAAIGTLHGLIITKAGVPSFVVTLAGFLVWNGVVLLLIGGLGTVVIQDRVIVGVANEFLPPLASWAVVAALVVLYASVQFARVRARRASGLPAEPTVLVVARVVGLALLAGGAVAFANASRGVPYVGVLILVLVVGWSFVANRTAFGRHVYAVGGNAEAARRAGINVDRIRVSVFVIASMMAAVGGIILASRLRSVDTGVGGGNLLLNAIAAAVIGGTSLFGGHGRVISALLGAAVIASVDNGMGLLGMSAGARFVVTGLILLAAVVVDSFTRKGRTLAGLA